MQVMFYLALASLGSMGALYTHEVTPRGFTVRGSLIPSVQRLCRQLGARLIPASLFKIFQGFFSLPLCCQPGRGGGWGGGMRRYRIAEQEPGRHAQVWHSSAGGSSAQLSHTVA